MAEFIGATDQQQVLDSGASKQGRLVSMVAVPLAELGMYGTSMDGVTGWCICGICDQPVHQPEPGYQRAQANEDLARHLHDAHQAHVWESAVAERPTADV